MTLGRYPTLSLGEARNRARRALYQIASDQDPAPTKPNSDDGLRGFREACRNFGDTYCAQHNRRATRNHRELVLRNRFVAVWGDRDIRSIVKADVLKVLDGILAEGLPSAANNAFVTIRKFFNWCVERGLVDTNPCAGIRRPAKTKSRSRVLSDDELRAIWLAANKIGAPYGTIVKLLTLTAQRRNEVASLRKVDLDFARRLWTLKPETTKNSRGHVVPLPSHAAGLLLSAASESDMYLFPAMGRLGYFDDFSKQKTRIDRLSSVSGWTLHDLRRTAATNLARLGTAPHVVEQILNHRSGTLSGVAGIYNRFAYLEEMRSGLQEWQAYIETLVSGSHSVQ